MARTPPDDAPRIPEESPEARGAYDAPADLDETTTEGEGSSAPERLARPAAHKVAIAVTAILLVGAGLLAYRAHHRRQVIAEGLARADVLIRLDTAAGYTEAASLLEPLAKLDPEQAASVRAFALAMLFSDYRAAGADERVESLLVTPGRAEVVPPYAHLATAALALGRREVGTATTAAVRAGDGAWPRVLQARLALLAGNLPGALEPAAAAASGGAFAPGLALHGDVLRRLRRDPAAARAAYEAALDASAAHPRAAYGLAKLALEGHAPTPEAEAALERLLADRGGTPDRERARAALHLAALRLRGGDRPGANGALAAAGLDGPARSWAERASAVEAENHGAYRAVAGAPPALQSASDDDPPELSPTPPPPPRPAARPVVRPPTRRAPEKSTVRKHAAPKKKAKKAPARKKARRRR